MPEPQPAKKLTGTSVRRPVRAKDPAKAKAAASNLNPSWYAPLMLGLMVVGLVWIVVYYLTAGAFPVAAWGNWNLGAGFALIIAGFLMTTNWR